MNNEPNIQLINADWRDILPDYKNNAFDLAIVDPPYGLGMHETIAAGSVGKKKEANGKISKIERFAKTDKKWDVQPPSKKYFKELKRISKNQIVWGANHIYPKRSSCWIVWDKRNGSTYQSDCELAWTSFDTAVRKFSYLWCGMIQEQQNKFKAEKRIHPTQKPVALYRWLLQNYANEGDKILDTHLGSGSIAIACYEERFDLTACEIDKDYYDAMMKRFEKYKKQLQLF